jgi:hypothetical protein
MRITQLLGMTAAIITGAAVLTACGDDAATALSKPDFVEQANAICQVTTDELAPVWEEMWSSFEALDIDDPANQDLVFVKFGEILDVTSPAWREAAGEIRQLGMPEGDQDELTELFDDLESALDEFDVLIDAAIAGDEAARAAMDDTDPMTDVHRRARAYGLDVCGEDG